MEGIKKPPLQRSDQIMQFIKNAVITSLILLEKKYVIIF